MKDRPERKDGLDWKEKTGQRDMQDRVDQK